MIKIGIIGGSGLDDPNILEDAKEIDLETKFGKPTSSLKIGRINNIDVVLLARHGRKHQIPPTQVNYRANIQALKEAGCTHILATTACGSLREQIRRGDFVIVDQFIDFTRHRAITFHESFAKGMKHTPMATPFDNNLRKALINTSKEMGLKMHEKGTVVTIEGPRFSTKAESHMFRTWGADVINMSIAPEAILANEANIPYAAVAMSTDFDCWKDDEEPVTFEEVLKVFEKNADNVKQLLINTIPKVGKEIIETPKIQAEKIEIKIDNDHIKSKIRTIPHFPKQGIMFRDITTLLKDPQGLKDTVHAFVQRYKDKNIKVVAGIEARGFILGGVVAKELGVGFVPIRKKGKLPAEIVSQEYELEYGTDKIEMHKDAISQGDNVLLIDDLVATAGTSLAAAKLIEQLGGKVHEMAFIVDLPDIGGRKKIEEAGYKMHTLVEFEGD